MNNRLRLVFFLIISMVTSTLFAGGWGQPEGTGYLKVYGVYATAKNAYNFEGKLYPIENYSDISFRVFIDYGIMKNVSVSVDIPLFQSYSLGIESTSGIGDPLIGLSYALNQEGNYPLTVEWKLRLPLGETGRLDNPIPVGWNELSQVFEVTVGHSFYPVEAYGKLGSFYGLRERPLNDEFGWLGELGFTGWKPFLLSLKMIGKYPIGNIKTTGAQVNGAANGVSYTALISEVGFMFSEKMGTGYSISTAFGAKNIYSSLTHSFGFWTRF